MQHCVADISEEFGTGSRRKGKIRLYTKIAVSSGTQEGGRGQCPDGEK
jgi:hypothetical protein